MVRPKICYCIEEDCPNEHPDYNKCLDCGCEEELEEYTTPDGTLVRVCDPCFVERRRQDTDDPMGIETQARLEMDND